MAPYWLDTNIFIESKNRAYAFDLAPGFWTWIEKLTDEGKVRCPKRVYDEVHAKNDQLKNWLRMMKARNLFVNADSAVVRFQAEITSHVVSKYTRDKADYFMRGADPWIIAHAGCCAGTVVTAESGFKGKIQIPEVCDHFSIRCKDLYSLGRALGLKLILSND